MSFNSPAHKPWVRALAIILIATFINQDIVWAQGSVGVTVPKNIASTKEVLNSGGKTIINIQDAHASVGAQESISAILDSLVNEYDLKVIAIEGSSGYIDTSLLKTFPDEAVKKQAASDLVKQGRMSAGEFFAITSSRPVAIYGVEDQPLYQENVSQFRSVYDANNKILKYMDSLSAALNALKEKVYSKELNELEASSAMHRDGKIDFSARWEELFRLARKAGLDYRAAYTNIGKLVGSFKLEKKIDFDKANKERERLIDALTKKLPKKELEELVLKSVAFKAGKMSRSEYYIFLRSIARTPAVDPALYANLIAYTDYIVLYESIDLVELFSELKSFEGELAEKFLKNDYEARLYKFAKCVEFLKSVFSLKLMSEDFDYLSRNLETCNAQVLAGFIAEASAKYNVRINRSYDLEKIFAEVPKALAFYRTAEKRNETLLDNTIKRMGQEGANVAALITGGYHSKGIGELLKGKKASYFVVLPKFDASKGERPYAAILTKKTEPYSEGLKTGQYHLATSAYFAADASVTEEARFAEYERDFRSMLDSAVAGIEGAEAKNRQKKAIADMWASNYRRFYEGFARMQEARQQAGQAPIDFTPRTPERVEALLSGLAVSKDIVDPLFTAVNNALSGVVSDISTRDSILSAISQKMGEQAAQGTGLEIEKKFLLTAFPEFLKSHTPERIVQGYLYIDNDIEIRARQKGAEHFVTVKTSGTLSRREVEIPVSSDVYGALMPLAQERVITKDRYTVQLSGGLKAEVDIYYGKCGGLVTLETELPDAKTALPSMPAGMGQLTDVTERKEFKNKNLALYGISTLQKPAPSDMERERPSDAKTLALFLAQRDALPAKVDLIIAFGNEYLQTVDETVRLVAEGRADTVIFAGGEGHSTANLIQPAAERLGVEASTLKGISEAEIMERVFWHEMEPVLLRDKALAKPRVYLETRSRNCGENVTLASKRIEDLNSSGENIKVESVILITQPPIQRRVDLTFKRWQPDTVFRDTANIYNHAAFIPDGAILTDEKYQKTLVREAQNLENYPFRNFTIPLAVPGASPGKLPADVKDAVVALKEALKLEIQVIANGQHAATIVPADSETQTDIDVPIQVETAVFQEGSSLVGFSDTGHQGVLYLKSGSAIVTIPSQKDPVEIHAGDIISVFADSSVRFTSRSAFIIFRQTGVSFRLPGMSGMPVDLKQTVNKEAGSDAVRKIFDKDGKEVVAESYRNAEGMLEAVVHRSDMYLPDGMSMIVPESAAIGVGVKKMKGEEKTHRHEKEVQSKQEMVLCMSGALTAALSDKSGKGTKSAELKSGDLLMYHPDSVHGIDAAQAGIAVIIQDPIRGKDPAEKVLVERERQAVLEQKIERRWLAVTVGGMALSSLAAAALAYAARDIMMAPVVLGIIAGLFFVHSSIDAAMLYYINRALGERAGPIAKTETFPDGMKYIRLSPEFDDLPGFVKRLVRLHERAHLAGYGEAAAYIFPALGMFVHPVFDVHCRAIYTMLGECRGDDVYRVARNMAGLHRSFLIHGSELPQISAEGRLPEVSQEALNVMGVLASKAKSAKDIHAWCSLFVDIPAIRKAWLDRNTPHIRQFLLKNSRDPAVQRLETVYGVNISGALGVKIPEDRVEAVIGAIHDGKYAKGSDVIAFTSAGDHKSRRKEVALEAAGSADHIIGMAKGVVSADGADTLAAAVRSFVDGTKDHELYTFTPAGHSGSEGRLILLKDGGLLYYGIMLVREGFAENFDTRIRETLPYKMKYIPLFADVALIDYRNNSKLDKPSPALEKLLDMADANQAGTTCSYNPVGSIEIMVEKEADGSKRYYIIAGSSGFQPHYDGHHFTVKESKEAIADALREMGTPAEKIPALVEERFAMGTRLYVAYLVARGFAEDALANVAVTTLPCSVISDVIGREYCRRHKKEWQSKLPYRPREMCPSKCAERGAKLSHRIARVVSYDRNVPAIELLGGAYLNDGSILVRYRDADTGVTGTHRISAERMAEEEKKVVEYEKVVDISSSTPLCIHCAEQFGKFNNRYVKDKNVYIYRHVRPYDYNKGAGDLERQKTQDLAAVDMVMQSGKMAYIQLAKAPALQAEKPWAPVGRALLDAAMKEIDAVVALREEKTDELPIGALRMTDGDATKEAVLIVKPPAASGETTVEEVLKRVQAFGYEIVGARVFDGAYFNEHPETIAVLYQEAYEGYTSDKQSPSVMHNIRQIYDTPDFEFFFNEPYSDDMVIPADRLRTLSGLSESEITEIWEKARFDITFDDLRSRFGINSVEVRGDGIHLSKKDKELILPTRLLGAKGDSIIWFRNDVCFGLNKVGYGRNIFPVQDKRINGGKPVLVMNGYVPGLSKMFKEPLETRTVAVVVRSANGSSASWKDLRAMFLGDNNDPRGDNLPGSVRKDAVLKELPLPFDPADKHLLNGGKNVAHLSAGPLEGAAEICNIFGVAIKETSFGRLMLDSGYSEAFIRYLTKDPSVRIFDERGNKYDSRSIFELTAKKEPAEALELIKRYFPPINEDDPKTSASVDFDEFIELQQSYKDRKITNAEVPGSDLEAPHKQVRTFQEAAAARGFDMKTLGEDGMKMVGSGRIAEIVPGGGTSGRFFGYRVKMPESQKIKLLAPIWKIAGVLYNSIEVKMMYLRHLVRKAGGGSIPIAVMGSGNNIGYLEEKAKESNIYPEGDLYFYAQGEIPRLNPTDSDMRDSGAATDSSKYNLPYGKNAEANTEKWLEDNGEMGDIFRSDDGSYTGKPPGHFDIIAKLVLSRRLFELASRGVEVLHVANGDDVGATLDPAKAAYLMRSGDVNMLALLVDKNTVYTIKKDDELFDETVRAADPDGFGPDVREFRVIARDGRVIAHNLPKGIAPALEGQALALTYEGRSLKSGIKGKAEKGGTFIHIRSKSKDTILDQPLPGRAYSSNQFYITVKAVMDLFGLTMEEYARISQADLLRKVRKVTAEMMTHVEIKPIAVGQRTGPGGTKTINMRPAAQFARYIGEMTALRGIEAEAFTIDRDGSSGREAYAAVKEPEDVQFLKDSVYRILGLSPDGSVSTDPKVALPSYHAERVVPSGEVHRISRTGLFITMLAMAGIAFATAFAAHFISNPVAWSVTIMIPAVAFAHACVDAMMLASIIKTTGFRTQIAETRYDEETGLPYIVAATELERLNASVKYLVTMHEQTHLAGYGEFFAYLMPGFGALRLSRGEQTPGFENDYLDGLYLESYKTFKALRIKDGKILELPDAPNTAGGFKKDAKGAFRLDASGEPMPIEGNNTHGVVILPEVFKDVQKVLDGLRDEVIKVLPPNVTRYTIKNSAYHIVVSLFQDMVPGVSPGVKITRQEIEQLFDAFLDVIGSEAHGKALHIRLEGLRINPDGGVIAIWKDDKTLKNIREKFGERAEAIIGADKVNFLRPKKIIHVTLLRILSDIDENTLERLQDLVERNKDLSGKNIIVPIKQFWVYHETHWLKPAEYDIITPVQLDASKRVPENDRNAVRKGLLRVFKEEEGVNTPRFMIGMPAGTLDKTARIVEQAAKDAVSITGRNIELGFFEDGAKGFNEMVERENIKGIYLDESLLLSEMEKSHLTPKDKAEAIAKVREMSEAITAEISAIVISASSRKKVENAMGKINDLLPKIESADIDKDAAMAELKISVTSLEEAIKNRKSAVRKLYNSVSVSAATDIVKAKKGAVAIALTERVIANDLFSADNMEEIAGNDNISPFFVFGTEYGGREPIMTPEKAKEYLRICGYTERALQKVRFIDGKGLSCGEIVGQIEKETGLAASNIGIAAIEGEIGRKPEDQGLLLEVGAVEIGGKKFYATMNSMQALLNVIANFNGTTLDSKVPDVEDGQIKGVFRYLPRAVPIDYSKEIETYRTAMELIRTAA